ncbi:MAG: hypothetical protein AAGA86_02130 [Bacteroidota bacterium]
MEYKELIQYVHHELAISFWLTGDYTKSMACLKTLRDSQKVPSGYPDTSEISPESGQEGHNRT